LAETFKEDNHYLKNVFLFNFLHKRYLFAEFPHTGPIRILVVPPLQLLILNKFVVLHAIQSKCDAH